jgi:DNA-binding GntR family transcriptional regulator
MSALPISTPKPKDATQKVADALAWRSMNIGSHPQQSWAKMNLARSTTQSASVVRAALQSLAHVQLADPAQQGAFVAVRPRVKRAEVFQKPAFAGTAPPVPLPAVPPDTMF